MKSHIKSRLTVLIHAEVQLPKVIGSNMVLQRNQPVKIWGWADKGEKVTVSIHGQEMRAKTGKDGSWMLTLEPMKAGGPQAMTITGKNSLVLENILIGDVWVCSGQSNMEWVVANSNHADEEIQDGNRIILRSGAVDSPVAVRYGWADNPQDANLFNTEGLPASPFRTDDWPGVTYGK